jgi:putative redox protein
MPLDTLIADTRRAIAEDAARAQAAFTAEGTLVGVTAVRVEVAVTGPETRERYAELAAAVDEHCPVLDLFRNPVSRDIVTSR